MHLGKEPCSSGMRSTSQQTLRSAGPEVETPEFQSRCQWFKAFHLMLSKRGKVVNLSVNLIQKKFHQWIYLASFCRILEFQSPPRGDGLTTSITQKERLWASHMCLEIDVSHLCLTSPTWCSNANKFFRFLTNSHALHCPHLKVPLILYSSRVPCLMGASQ